MSAKNKKMKKSIFLIVVLSFLGLGLKSQTMNSVLDNRILDAVEMYNSRNLDGAMEILQKIVEEDPSKDAAHYYIALAAIEKKDLVSAERHLRQAVELDGANFWYRQRLASLYASTSRPELAVDIYEKLLKDFPKKSDIYFELVELYAAQKEIDKALDTLKEIETVFGITESIAMYRFNLLRISSRQEEAYASLEEYNKKYSSPYVLSTLADWQMSMYNDSTALAYYDEALDIAPDYAPALLGKAETLRLTRKYDGYFTVLGTFVKDPDTAPAGKNDYLMAIIQRSDPKFLKSFSSQIDTVVNAALKAHPSDSLITNLAALWNYSMGRNEEAGRYFRANAENYPESVGHAASLVEFLMYAQMWEELSEEGRKAFGRFPGEPAFLEMAGVGDYNRQDYEGVMEMCDKVLEAAPADSSHTLRSWSTKGDIYYLLGEKNKAYKAYEKALKVNPDYVYVLNNYAYYLSTERKNLKKAYQMSKKTVEAEPDNATYLDTFGWILYLMGKPLEAKPFFKHAMLYGGKESAVIMDHYAEVLYALKEYDLAFVYWNMARQKNKDGEIKDLDERVARRKQEVKQ